MAGTIATLLVRLGVDFADFDKKIGQAERSFKKSGQNLERLGSSLTKGITVPLLAIGGTAIKAAVDFESSFAGVRKTVDASEKQFAELAQGFRDLAKTIPINVNELNKIGEAAGQLGINTENILGFTKVVADLGVTTNLSADQAASSLARLANITGLPQEQFSNLGSTIVALGNNFATTEAEIVEFGLRIAGAGKTIGLSEAQILGFGTALSSVGINAEAGGTAISKVFIELASSVNKGGKDLENFARVATGTTGKAKEFAAAFKTDAAGAVVAFIEGLGKIQKAGGDVFGTIEKLGLQETRLRDALLRSAGAGDLLRNAMDLGTRAFSENTALAKEAEQRYKTTASQFILLKNNVQDVAITFGQALLPAINDTITSSRPVVAILVGMAQGFADLPRPIRDTTLAFIALAASIGPVLFLFGKVTLAGSAVAGSLRLIPSIVAGASTAFLALTAGLTGVSTGVTGATGAIFLLKGAFGILAAPLTVVIGLLGGWKLGRLIGETTGWTDAIEKLALRLKGIPADLAELTVNSRKAGEAALKAANDGFKVAEERAKDLKEELSGAKLQQNVKDLTVAFQGLTPAQRAVADTMKRTGDAALLLAKQGAKLPPELQALADAAKKASEETGNLPPALEGTAKKLKGVEAALKGLRDKFRDSVDTAKAYAIRLKEVGGITQATTSFKNQLNDALQDVIDTYGSLKKAGLEALQGLFDKTKPVIDGVRTLATMTVTPLVESMSRAIAAMQRMALQTASATNELTSFVVAGGTLAHLSSRVADDVVSPFRAAFDAFGHDLPDIIFRTLQGGGSLVGAIASGLAVKFGDVFNKRLKEITESGIKDIGGDTAALGAAGVGLSAFIGGFGIGQSQGKLKGALGGAASGALAGAAFGSVVPGIGTAIGAIGGALAGALGGLFGGASKARKELAALNIERDKFLKGFGGFANLQRTAESLGVTIGNAFSTKKPQEFEAFINRLNAAVEAQKQRMEGLGLAVEGVNRRAELLAAPFRELLAARDDLLSDKGKEADPLELKAINQRLQGLAETAQPAFERLGAFVAATFAGIVRETGDAIGAIQQLAPSFQVLQDGIEKFGLTGTGTITSLVGMFKLVTDEVTGPLFQALSATGQIFTGLQQAGALTGELFQVVGADIGGIFRELEAKGVDMSVAMALSQPVLQRLWEAQRTFGSITDDTTAKILKQAHEQGLVGDHMKDVNQKILDVLIAIGDVLGATIPDALRGLRPVARDAADDIAGTFASLRIPEIDLNFRGKLGRIDFEGGSFDVPGFAHGGIVKRPTFALIGEAGPEAVIPLDQVGAAGGIVINSHVNVSEFFGDDPDSMRRLSDKVGKAVSRDVQLHTRLGRR